MRIDGSSVLVVGGASGLGAATARRLAGMGADVTVADLQTERGEAVAGEIGGRFIVADVTDPEAVQQSVELAANRPGGLRATVTCAGIGTAQRTVSRKGPHEVDPYVRVLTVNLIGTFHVLRLSAAAMGGNDPDEGGERGVVVQTASIAAFDGQIGQLAYSASKGGVVGMTLPAARDLASLGVRVMTIAPGLFDTPLLAGLPEPARQALGSAVPFPARLGDPDEYGRLAAAILENPMLNGEVIRLDGALRMAPR